MDQETLLRPGSLIDCEVSGGCDKSVLTAS
jgi:hypothetical protein